MSNDNKGMRRSEWKTVCFCLFLFGCIFPPIWLLLLVMPLMYFIVEDDTKDK